MPQTNEPTVAGRKGILMRQPYPAIKKTSRVDMGVRPLRWIPQCCGIGSGDGAAQYIPRPRLLQGCG